MSVIKELSYIPSDDEEFMNDRQKEYFRAKLLSLKAEILEGARKRLQDLAKDGGRCADAADRAALETNNTAECRTHYHQSLLLNSIDNALDRLVNDTYGYCEETGEQIPLQRLQARPAATLSLEAQQRREFLNKLHRF